MTATTAFARKEVREILRTWRILVLPLIALVFATTGPLLAEYTPQLVAAVAGNQFQALHLPTPTVLDASGQWIKNLSQIMLFALIISYGGIVSSERRSGTAVLVLSKPLSRAAFVIVKAVIHMLYVTVILVLGTLVTWAVSALVFGRAPAGPFWSSAFVWLVLAVVYLALMTLFSVLIPSAAGAAGAGLGAFVVLSVGVLWKPIADYSPAGLPARAASLAAGTATDPLAWPIAVSLVVAIAAVGLAALLFQRQEL